MPHLAKVLIVDDEPHLRKYFGQLVRANLGGPAILEAGDGATATALYATENPDLVLLDINLIGGSGLDVLGELRAADPEAVVVMVTAVDVRTAIEEAMAKGAAGYILKDSPFEEISAALKDIVAANFEDPSTDNPPA